MKLIPIMSEEELTKFYLQNYKQDIFLKFLYEECNKRIISYYETESSVYFGQFIESRSIFNNYILCKYGFMLSQVNLTNYFCNLNNLDFSSFYGNLDYITNEINS